MSPYNLIFHFLSLSSMVHPGVFNIVKLNIVYIVFLGLLSGCCFLFLGFETNRRHPRALPLPFNAIYQHASRWGWVFLSFPCLGSVGGECRSCKSSFWGCYCLRVHSWESKIYGINGTVYYAYLYDLHLDWWRGWVYCYIEFWVNGNSKGRPLYMDFLTFGHLVSIYVYLYQVSFLSDLLSSSDLSISIGAHRFLIDISGRNTNIKRFMFIDLILLDIKSPRNSFHAWSPSLFLNFPPFPYDGLHCGLQSLHFLFVHPWRHFDFLDDLPELLVGCMGIHFLLQSPQILHLFVDLGQCWVSWLIWKFFQHRSKLFKFSFFLVLQFMLINPYFTNIDFEFKWHIFLLVVSLRKDGIFLECTDCLVVLSGDISQPRQMVMEKLAIDYQLWIFLEKLLTLISHHSWFHSYKLFAWGLIALQIVVHTIQANHFILLFVLLFLKEFFMHFCFLISNGF